ncbi:MAG: hypothetical protein HY036_03215 [Nitrospirae bacterium]|nr:hypothetical protein [Nitrospirota bacterium]MBI3351565.1 hypothetical protein [Nitrospirota bacterium]
MSKKLTWALAGLLSIGLLTWSYFKWVYSPIIFKISAPFDKPIPHQVVPAGISGIKASDCGTCHTEIYQEWQASIHGNAWKDPFFQAYWKKDKQIWICLNCHTPVENQQEFLIRGFQNEDIEKPVKVKNSNFDPAFQEEGISCAACHVRNGVVYGPFKDMQAPHPTEVDPKFRTAQICLNCHHVPKEKFMFYRGNPCNTQVEWEDGPYAKKGMICQDCHMPKIERPLVTGGPVREVRRHLWWGGHQPAMLHRALQVDLKASQAEYRPGETALYILTLNNGGAGHKLPTGDPDRYFTIEFNVMNSAGKVIQHTSKTIGRWLIWKPVIFEYYDNRLNPLEKRDFFFSYPVPSGGEKLNLEAKVTYHIMAPKAHQRLVKKYGLSPADPTPIETVLFDESFSLEKGAQAGVVQAGKIHPACSS